MDSNTYFILEIQKVSVDIEDQLVGELFEIGAQGVQEDLAFTQLDRKYKPSIIEKDVKSLFAYFIEKPETASIDCLIQSFPDLQLSINKQPIKDWLAEWKAQWKPFAISDNVWIVPDWERETFNFSGKQALFIEPGMAFGTGTHETTQIASQLLVNLIENESIQSFLDVGTGSGILALLAGLKKVSSIYAYDNDQESKRVFLENIEKNNQTSLQWEENWSTQLNGQIDLTLANIIDGVLLDLKPEFQKIKSSFYIFTGILVEREEYFLSEMLTDWPLVKVERLQKGEWVGFSFRVSS